LQVFSTQAMQIATAKHKRWLYSWIACVVNQALQQSAIGRMDMLTAAFC